jgi:chitinase
MRVNAGEILRKLLLLFSMGGLGVLAPTAHAGFWTTGYYPGWEQAGMPATNIDFSTLSHIIHFSVVPNTDGTLDASANTISPENSAAVVTAAHAAGRKVLICVGGGGTESLFQGATSDANLPVFINNLTNFMATRGYDGVDIDWEPLPSTDAPQYTSLVNGLRTAMNGFAQSKLLTAAVGAYPPYGDSATADYSMFASLQTQFDQLNIMTYDLSGPYEGWVTWFNSPIYDGGYRFPSNGNLVPSVDGAVNNFLASGVASSKLGIGIAFYGYLWTGGSGTSPACITKPRQSWTNAPTIAAIRYSDVMAGYYQSNLYQWDTSAQSAYIGVTNSIPTNNIFLSYDDPRTCQAKLSYARNHALGGVMIWELAQDHQGTQHSPLVQALKQALATPGWTNLQRNGSNVDLTFAGIPLGSYRVQYKSNLTDGVWSTLLVTNVTGAGGLLQINDAGAATSQAGRYYRIQTPP